MSELHPTWYNIAHIRAGEVIWESGWGPNDLADEGENDILSVYLRGATAPTSFYFALAGADPGETGTLATMTEVTGTGYARIAVARNTTDWPTLALDSGDFKATSATKTFTAGGNWTNATHLVLCTAASGTAGKLVAYKALGATRSLINTDQLAVSMAVKLQ